MSQLNFFSKLGFAGPPPPVFETMSQNMQFFFLAGFPKAHSLKTLFEKIEKLTMTKDENLNMQNKSSEFHKFPDPPGHSQRRSLDADIAGDRRNSH